MFSSLMHLSGCYRFFISDILSVLVVLCATKNDSLLLVDVVERRVLIIF